MSAKEPGFDLGPFTLPPEGLPLAFGSLERANGQREASDRLRLALEVQEASVFFLAIARLFAFFPMARQARVSLGDGLQVFSDFAGAQTGEPISVLERCGELYDLAEAEKERNPGSALGAELSAEADQMLSIDRLFYGAWERFNRLSPAFANILCAKPGARYAFDPGEAPAMARQAGFERLAALMEQDALSESLSAAGGGGGAAETLRGKAL